MKNLKKLLKTPLERVPKWLPIVLLVIALIGFADATYLTVEHYSNKIPPCTIGSCETVLTSDYATVAGIPVALVGSIFYLFILVLSIVYLDIKKELLLRIIFLTTTLGFLVSIYFFILQALVINAFCQYCLVSAGTSTLLFLTSLYTFIKFRAKEIQNI